MENHQPIKQEVLTNSPQTAWIFDVDGVITNPAEKKVTELGLIDAIAKKIDSGDIVALNTGRSVSWMIDRVISPIKDAVRNKSKLINFLAVGEKGGTWAYFENGEMVAKTDEEISIPQSLENDVRRVIEDDFAGKMFYDESKLTMLSTEMIDGRSIQEYAQEQLVLIEKMKEIIGKSEYQSLDLKIDPTTIATDIQNPNVGKHFGARRIVNWLEKRGIKPTHIIALGDSQSDTEMAEELQDEYPVEFVFVGDKSKLDSSKLKKEPVFTEKRFGEGTLEFLSSFKE